MKCPTCDSEFKSYTAVSLHYRNKHGTGAQFRETMRQKYVDENCGGVTPVCKCGCGVVPKYYDYERGYVEFVRGHASRINNNWGHNKAALDKSHATTKSRYDAGELEVWNKGQTSETDERIAAYGNRGHKTIMSNPEECKARSERLKKGRLDGTVPTLFGSQHGRWKGGVSSIQQLSRSYVFNVWTYPKLLAANFTCQRCGANKDLEVHHDQERFAEILQKARIELGDVTDSFESHQAYARWVADYHVANNVSGVVLCEQCHDQEHSSAA